MSAKKHHVELSAEQRRHAQKVARSNKAFIRERVRARILLAVDAVQSGGGQKDADAAWTAGRHAVTVAFVRQRFGQRGLEATLHHREQTRRKARKLDGAAEAHPGGLGLRRAACRAQAREPAPARRPAGGGGLLRGPQPRDGAPDAQKNARKPWLKKRGCIPPKANAEFVAAMEDTLEVYHRPFDAARPLICLDEAAKQLLGEVRVPLPRQPGQPARFDGESTRAGTAALFMVCEPLAGQRHVFVHAQRQRLDFAAVIQVLCDELYPAA